MFEDRTYENIMAECLATAPAGIDVRQGGIFYDAVASACLKIAQYYADLRHAFDLVFLTTAVDEYLDRLGAEYQVQRNPASAARYGFAWAGAAAPKPGERFFAEGLYFSLRSGDDASLHLEAEIPGSGGNGILPGTPAVPVNNIAGLTAASFGQLAEPGADAEDDEHYRGRIQEKIAGQAENGNRQHYKTWCESIPGVQRARIIPLFAGENTVMAILIGPDGLPASQTVVERVQEYIDPMTLGLTVSAAWGETIPVGDGLGDGAANIGAHFAARSPERVDIDVSFAAELRPGASLAQLLEDAKASLASYLKELSLATPEKERVVVRMSAVSSLLYALPGLLDYTGLKLNGATANLEIADRQVAALGEVDVVETV